jgi:hypothetical protein
MNFFTVFGLVVYFIIFAVNFNRMYLMGSMNFFLAFMLSFLWPLYILFILVGSLISIFNASRGR